MANTFDFLTAIKHLLDGKKVRGKDWIGSWLMLDKNTKCVYNERGQRLDIMQFMNINEWVLLDSNVGTNVPDDRYVDEFTSYKYDFEEWPIPDTDNWLFKFSNNYHPHKGDIIVYKEVADYHRELKTLNSCPTGKIIRYNDYVVYVKFTNKETPVELSIEEMKQLYYIVLNEESCYNIPSTIYYNEDGSSFTTSIAFEDDMHYTDTIISIADVVNKVSNITIVDLIMNYHWDDGSPLSKFDVNEFKQALNSEPDNLIEEILESGDKLYASIPYGQVPPKEGDTVIPKNSKAFTDRNKIIHTTPYDVDILHYFIDDPYNYDMEEFIEMFNKLIPNDMPALVSRNGKLSTNDEIYYEYDAGQNETFIIIDVKIGNFSKKGITIQRKSNPDDIYEISLRDLHRLFTWKV